MSERRDWLKHEDDAIIAYLSERIEQWKAAGCPPAQTYFKAGLARQVAHMIAAAEDAAYDKAIVAAAPYHNSVSGRGCPRFCGACERSREIQENIRALKARGGGQ